MDVLLAGFNGVLIPGPEVHSAGIGSVLLAEVPILAAAMFA